MHGPWTLGRIGGRSAQPAAARRARGAPPAPAGASHGASTQFTYAPPAKLGHSPLKNCPIGLFLLTQYQL